MAETDKEKRRKILVTGSSGMLGTDLCRELSADFDVTGLDVLEASTDSEWLAEYIECDITDKREITRSITYAKPDIIAHLAAWTDVDGCELDPDRAHRVNTTGTGHVAEAAKSVGALLLFLSTDFVFDGGKQGPYNEEDAPGPLSVYGRSKLEAENKVRELGNHIIVRTSWLFGRNGRNFVDSILEQAKKSKMLRVVDDQRGCPTYTKDLAAAINRLLAAFRRQKTEDRRQIREIFHVSNRGVVSWFDYARVILEIAGLETEVIPIKSPELKRPAARPANSALDISKFEKFTGHKMRDWREALKDYLVDMKMYRQE